MGKGSWLFNLFLQIIPYFEIFRQPYKFIFFILPLQALLVGYMLDKIAFGRIQIILILTVVIVIIGFRMSPMINGNFSNMQKTIEIPNEYYKAKEIIESYDNLNDRIFIYPQTRGTLRYSWAKNYRT